MSTPSFIKKNDLEEAKRTLLDHYRNILTSQATRLIGFAAALFTLLQAVQTSKASPLSEIFSIPTFIDLSIFSPYAGTVQLIALLLLIWGLLVFMIRTIFRYSVYAKICERISTCPLIKWDKETKRAYDNGETSIQGLVITKIVSEMKASKEVVYWRFPCTLFISSDALKRENRRGWLWCLVISLLLTIVILWLLW